MDTITLGKDNREEVIVRAVQALRRGRVIVYPTDTLYGLGADIMNEAAVRRLFALKGRPASKPVPVLVDGIEMARTLAFIDAKQEKILHAVWPGALTAVLWKKHAISSLIAALGQTVGLRMPKRSFCLELVRALGGPITATSANVSGEQGSVSLAAVLGQFKKEKRFPDFVIDAGELPPASASTVLDCTGTKPKVLRMGPITLEKMKEILDI